MNFIETSASGTINGETYGYLFTISETADPSSYHAVLTNTSSAGSGASIHKMAFNLGAVLGTDFTIGNVSPSWTFDVPNGNGVQFETVGTADGPGSTNKLPPGASLSFDFDFAVGFVPSLALWTNATGSLGTGLGGGTDSGQVVVHFQSLGVNGDSDLLASSWVPSSSSTEPSTLVLLGTGLLGVATFLRRRQQH